MQATRPHCWQCRLFRGVIISQSCLRLWIAGDLWLGLSPLLDTSWITAAATALLPLLHCSRHRLNEHGMQNKATQDAIWPTEIAESFYEQLRYVHDNWLRDRQRERQTQTDTASGSDSETKTGWVVRPTVDCAHALIIERFLSGIYRIVAYWIHIALPPGWAGNYDGWRISRWSVLTLIRHQGKLLRTIGQKK